MGLLEKLFMRQCSFRSLFSGRHPSADAVSDDQPPIPELSSIANSVVSRCSRILGLPTENLQQYFETDLPDQFKQRGTYARNLLEYCSYKALHILTKHPDYLLDKDFRQLMYDMMLAWETPASGSQPSPKETSCKHTNTENEDEGSLFYTNSLKMAIQVDDGNTVGVEAFARIASACPSIAEPIIVHNLFYALTSFSCSQLHFLIFDKYLKVLDKVLKSAKNMAVPPFSSSLKLYDGEMILDVDGVIPTQPVLQHIGKSAWPGRLTLTNFAIYFEPFGVGLYDKPARYDLSIDLKQVIKREMTGPLGARLFDKAVMYKSISLAEPVFLEFPEFKGHARRDYWLAIIKEVFNVHLFIRKFNLRNVQQSEALSLASLGIFRFRALKEAFHITPLHFKTILTFNLAGKLPKGDKILEALFDHLQLLNDGSQCHDLLVASSDKLLLERIAPVSYYTLARMGFNILLNDHKIEERHVLGSGIHVGMASSLEVAVKESLCRSDKVEEAFATVNQVKVEGIDTNLAVMQELLFPLLESGKKLYFLASWEDPFKTSIFLIFIAYTVHSGWVEYTLPAIFLACGLIMLWNKYNGEKHALRTFQVNVPPSKNAVEQLLTLQDTISQLETIVQAGNIFLLKLRALLLSSIPQVTDKAGFWLIVTAVILFLLPFRHLVLLIFFEAFTREMPLRKKSTQRYRRRIKEWWVHIPAVPVQLVRPEERIRVKHSPFSS